MAQSWVSYHEYYWKNEPLQYFLSHFRYSSGTDLKFIELKLFGLFHFVFFPATLSVVFLH